MSVRWGNAWEQCYRFFGLDASKFDEEIACLRLAFYLGNFGMFRASGKLRGLDHFGYVPIIAICRRYAFLRDRNTKYLKKNLGSVFDFLAELEAAFKEAGISATPTLITKTALATTGCVPGYDRFVVSALRKRGIIGQPSNRGLPQLYRWVDREFVEDKGELRRGTLIMRQVDSFLWDEGRPTG